MILDTDKSVAEKAVMSHRDPCRNNRWENHETLTRSATPIKRLGVRESGSTP
jgi:hypothetical protein